MGFRSLTRFSLNSVQASHIQIFLLFVLTGVLGLSTSGRLRSIQPAAASESSPVFLIAAVFLSAAALVYLYRTENFRLVDIWFSLVYTVTGFVVFDMYLSTLMAAPAAALSVIAFRKAEFQWQRNSVSVVFFAGAVAMMGTILTVKSAGVFLVAYAIYDLAMFYRGPADEIVEARSDFFPGFRTDRVVLGAGDVIVPMAFAAAALSYSTGFAALSVTGAVLGLVAAFSLPKKSFPASPVISLLTFVGFAAGFLL